MSDSASKGLGCFSTGLPLLCLFFLLEMQKGRSWAGLFLLIIMMGLCCRYVLSRFSAPLVLLALLGLPSWSFLEEVDNVSPVVSLWFLLTLPCLVGAFFVALPYLALRGDRLIAQVLPRDAVAAPLGALLRGPALLLTWCSLWVAVVRVALPDVTIGYEPLGPVYFQQLSWGVVAIPTLMLLDFALVAGLRKERRWAAALLGPAAALLDFATAHLLVIEMLGLLWLAWFLAGLSLAIRGSLRTAWVVSSLGVMGACLWLAPGTASSISVAFVLVLLMLLAALGTVSQGAPGSWAVSAAALRSLSPFHWLLDVGAKVRWLDGEGAVFD